MILYCSFVDVLKLPQFSGFNEQKLLAKENDETILNMLYPYGVDKNKGLSIQACKHRTNDGKVVVSWRYVFEERRDKEHLWSGRATLEARINDTKDSSLIGELSVMADLYRTSRDGIIGACDGALAIKQRESGGKVVPRKDFEEDKEAVEQQILALQSIQKHVRGYLSSQEDVLFEMKTAEENLENDVS